MKLKVRPLEVSAGFVDCISSLSASSSDCFVRLPREKIPELPAATASTPESYLSATLASACTGTSGDVYVFRKDDCCGLVAIRGGDDNRGRVMMKSDTFIVYADKTGVPSDHGYACYRADSPAHHIDCSEYVAFRDQFTPGETYSMNQENAAVLHTAISDGITAGENFLQ